MDFLPKWGLSVLQSNLPDDLKKANAWVLWRAVNNGERVLKLPYTPDGAIAQVNNPKHRWDFDTVYRQYVETNEFSGIGFLLTFIKKPITVLDLDKCRHDGEIEPWAQELIDAANSYTEISPSGNGVRIFMYGNAGGFRDTKLGVECYCSGDHRYVTTTGQIIGSRRGITMIGNEIMEALEPYRPEKRDGEAGLGVVEDLTLDEIEEILYEIPASEFERYEPWLQLGMAIHHQWGGAPEGLEIWSTISEDTASYNRAELESKWDSFGLGGHREITIRSFLPKGGASSVPATPDDFPDLGADLEADIGNTQGTRADDEGDTGGDRQSEEPVGEGRDPGRDLGLTFGVESVNGTPPDEILEDTLAKYEVSAWTGPPGALKTMALLDLAVEMTSEHEEYGEWMGKKVKQGPVVWLAYEGRNAVQKRLRGYLVRQGGIPERLVLVQPKFFVKDGDKFRDWLADSLRAVIARVGHPQLVVIDTLAAATPGEDENSAQSMGAIATRLRSVATGARCHVAYIHHTPKGGSDDLRGSSVLTGDLDTLIRFEPTGGKGRSVDFEVRKQRNLGNIGEFGSGQVDVVRTGQVTSFGMDEWAPYMVPCLQAADQDTAEIEDLKSRIRDWCLARNTHYVDRSGWRDIHEGWLDAQYPDQTDTKKMDKLKADALKQLRKRGYQVDRNNSLQVSTITPPVSSSCSPETREEEVEDGGKESWE